jgi:hypothetical protein
VTLQVLSNSRGNGWSPFFTDRHNTSPALRDRLLRSTVRSNEVSDRWNDRWSLGRRSGDRVPLSEHVVLVLVECIDASGLELAGWDLLGEQNVELVEGAVLGLRAALRKWTELEGCGG